VRRFQIRKPERKKELLQEKSIRGIDECGWLDRCTFQNTKPDFFLLPEEPDPSVKHGNGDPVTDTYLFYRAYPDKIRSEDNEEETQGIGPVWNDTGRKCGMGMAAGITDIPWYRNQAGYLGCTVPFHQITLIVTKRAHASPGRTAGTALIRGQRGCCCSSKPLPV
jgi:hypothetical protein